MKKEDLHVIVSDWEFGAGKAGTSTGPKTLIEYCKESGLSFICKAPITVIDQKVTAADVEEIHYPHLKRALPLIEHQSRFADAIEDKRKNDAPLLLLTGDHSNAIGGLAGYCRNRDSNKQGVIWIDAHLDLHSPFTTPSGNIHGMSVNTVIEKDNLNCLRNNISEECKGLWNDIKGIKRNAPIPTENIVFIGIRSFEFPEETLIKDHNIKVIYAEEVLEKGITWAVNDALEYLDPKINELYVSFDVDSMDPSVSVGTGTPVESGISKFHAIHILSTLIEYPKTSCLEITEINPKLDKQKPMAKQVFEILNQI